MRIELMADSGQRYNVTLDSDKNALELAKRDDEAWKATFVYEQPEPAVLTLDGTFDGHRIRAKLRGADESSFLLVNRGFHWINEVPFNR
jgi:hypothetical protein